MTSKAFQALAETIVAVVERRASIARRSTRSTLKPRIPLIDVPLR